VASGTERNSAGHDEYYVYMMIANGSDLFSDLAETNACEPAASAVHDTASDLNDDSFHWFPPLETAKTSSSKINHLICKDEVQISCTTLLYPRIAAQAFVADSIRR